MTKRWLTTLATPVAAFVLVTGCGGGSANGPETAAEPAAPSATGAPTTETAGPLTTETGGTETALPTQDGEIAISVAGLPAGGEARDEEDAEQCVSVRYMGADEDQDLRIPDGSRLTVTGGSFSLSPDHDHDDDDRPEGPPVRIGGSACGSQEPLCLSGFAFTAQNDEADVGCFIPVQATQPPADGADEDTVTVLAVDLAINGELTCGGMSEEECAAFGRAAEAQEDSIPIRVPFVASWSSSSPSPSSSSYSSSYSPSSSSPPSSSSSYGSPSAGTSTSQG